jgi:hypothetical protein
MAPATRLLFVLAAALGTLTAPAGADEYWITYEGNDLPENEGWTRYWGNQDGEYQGDGAIRTLDDGVLTIDTLHDPWIYDYNWIDRPGEFDPQPGETLIAEWRLKVDEVVGVWCGPGVSLASDERWRVGFAFHEEYMWSMFEDDVFIPIVPDMFHEYRLVSSDVRSYDLYIDGELARCGTWGQFARRSRATWGDFSYPVSSRSQWDYFRFGVVPEPKALSLILVAMASCRRNTRLH